MIPLARLPEEEAGRLRGLFFDLDDTVLTHGRLTEEAYRALWSMSAAGLRLVAVTGRPSGWGEVLARQWPVDGVVTENGAIALVRDASGRGIERIDPCSTAERAARRGKLADLVEHVRSELPDVQLSDDAHARVSDVTWDIGERRQVAPDVVAKLASLVVRAGARTTKSSVHLHATFDGDDKASGAVRFAGAKWGDDSGATLATWAFVGDSGNDAACFAAVHTTVGVANVAPYVAQLSVPPRYVTTAAMGAGFAELAAHLVASRSRARS